MKKAMLVASMALALAACSRAERPAPAPVSARRTAAENRTAVVTSPLPLEERVLYYPTQERVLTTGDNSNDDMNWKSLGVSFPALLDRVRYGLTLVDTPLVDRDGNSKGTVIPEASRFTLLEAGPWVQWGSDFRRLYRVRFNVPGTLTQGWIDSSAAALILTEASGLAVGVVPRKIVIGGGESEYSLLAIADDRHVTLVDTSMFPFPDSFHPSGVVEVTLEDVNSDSQPEVLLEADTIVSLRYLGATPVRWKAWLRHGRGPSFRSSATM